jgi:hypothetical protein
MSDSRPSRGADARIALGNLWTSLRGFLDALPVSAARPAISYERSVLREVAPPDSAIERELSRLCNVAREALRAHRQGAGDDEGGASERTAMMRRRLEADRCIALGVLQADDHVSGVVDCVDVERERDAEDAASARKVRGG